ncbi:MAG: hypothetical protein JXJ17_00765 [Anaerolineae bacterium]|nr:hypothetical protein [Anaerolineae bacterium]
MRSEEKVFQIAREYLERTINFLDDEPHIRVQEEEFGWIVFYNSKRYVVNGEVDREMFGNAPLIISKDDYSVHVTGTARPLEYYIEQYIRTREEKKS